MRKSREQTPLALALLVSLLLHALLLSLTFGVDDFGLPGLAVPWRERRIVAPDLHVVLVPTQTTRAEPVVVSGGEPAREVPIDPPPAVRSVSTRSEVRALESPVRTATSARVLEQMAQGDPTPSAAVPAAAAAGLAQEHVRADGFEPPAPVQVAEPTAMDVERANASSWVVRADRVASAPVIAAATSAPSAETVPPASPGLGLSAQEAQREEAVRREAAHVEALLRLEAERQAAERQEVERGELMRQETARQETARQDAARQEAARQEAARQEDARQLAAEHEAQRQEAQRQDAARQQAARVELARLAAERQEAARQAAAQLEAERQERARAAAARLETEQQETASEEAARLEAARTAARREETARLAAAEREETTRRAAAEREDTARRAAAELEAQRQETARLEAARAQPARDEAAPPSRIAKEAPRVEPERTEEARREARLRAIGRQLDEEAARREAASKAAPLANMLPYSLSTARRARLWGRADPNAELVEYAEAFARKIQFNTLVETVQEVARRPHRPSMVTVALRSDGSVESVTFVVSSGVAEVDDAIKRIVDSHRPYPAFPPALAREFDVVEIRRTWVFDAAVRLQ